MKSGDLLIDQFEENRVQPYEDGHTSEGRFEVVCNHNLVQMLALLSAPIAQLQKDPEESHST